MSTASPTRMALSETERKALRETILKALEPIAPLWPMKSAVAQNPIHGLEYLSFDDAVRRGKQFRGGNGYLPNAEYRQLYRNGRISQDHLDQALQRVGPPPASQKVITIGSHQVTAQKVWTFHLIYGLETLPPSLLQWELGPDGVTQFFRQDLPQESRTRIIEQTIKECEHCREHPEQSYLTNLWKGTLTALGIPSPRPHAPTAIDHHSFDKDAALTPLDINLPPYHSISDWVGILAHTPIVEEINTQLTKWIATFVDEGLAGWDMPYRDQGFYASWRRLATYDHSGRIAGIQHYKEKVHGLPSEPEDTIVQYLHRLGIPPKQWDTYLSRMLCQLPGWASYIRWLGDHPAYHAQEQHPIDPAQYLAVRLFYEAELTEVLCQREWGVEGTISGVTTYWQNQQAEYQQRLKQDTHVADPATALRSRDAWRLFHLAQCLELSPIALQDTTTADAQQLLTWLNAFPSNQHGAVWLEAYEEGFRNSLLHKLSAHRGSVSPLEERPLAQLVFCIDVRSESFRRHIEYQGLYETLGFAGFFGIPIHHQAFDDDAWTDLCPVLLSPAHAVTERLRPGEDSALEKYSTGIRWHQLGQHLFHDLKYNPVGSMMLIDFLGLFFSAGLIGKTLLLKPFHAVHSMIRRWFSHPVPTNIPVDASSDPAGQGTEDPKRHNTPLHFAQGFTLEERATFIEGGLRVMGLTKNFGRFVVLCGHGSETDNNPYYAALDCGACGGKPGDANARVFAAMANDPEVRQILKEKSLPIPEDCWFLPGKHNTTTDRVTFYDLVELPETHQQDLQQLSIDLEQAGANQALERCHRIPGAPTDISSEQAFRHVTTRSFDWANPRPEWGLAGNAAFLIGRRTLTKGLKLDGRVFLHSYDPLSDPEGALLEKIMTAPLIVGEWINMGYYFSGVDAWNYGSGSKVLHNVVSGVGVMLGSQSDLQLGFPVQTVNNGAIHYHEPMRLLAIIEATPDTISSLIQKHAILQQLFHNQWLNLIALDPHTDTCFRYHHDAKWETVSL